MSDQDNSDDKKHPAPLAGRSGRAAEIGAELGELDFEPDALLDSLLADDPASTPLPLPGRRSSAPPTTPTPSAGPPRPGPPHASAPRGTARGAIPPLPLAPPREPAETLPDRGETADALRSMDAEPSSARPGSPFLSKRHFATVPPRTAAPRVTAPQAPRSLARDRDSVAGAELPDAQAPGTQAPSTQAPGADDGGFRGSGEWSPFQTADAAAPTADGPKLHEPEHRLFSADDETKAYRSPLATGPAAPDTPAAAPPARAKPPLPGARTVGSPGSVPRVPGARGAQVSLEATRQPPAVNPAGHPPREPFPPATSPVAPRATASVAPTPRAPGSSEATSAPSSISVQQYPGTAGVAGRDTPTGEIADVSDIEAETRAAFELADDADVSDVSDDGETGDADALLGAIESGKPSDAEIWTESEDWGEAEVNAPFQAISGGTMGAEAFDDPLADEFAQAQDEAALDVGFEGTEVATEVWEDEHDATSHLIASGQLEAWLARALWFEGEAESVGDAAARSRCLTVASELWAMAGEPERARAAALAATKAHKSPLALRQQRWLTQASEEWSQVASALEQEAIAGPTPESRAHAAYFSAEIHRVVLNDAETSSKKLDTAQRLLPSDPRGPLFKLTTELAGSAGAPTLKLPDTAELEPLQAASRSLSARRTAASDEALPIEAHLTLARRALAVGDAAGAGSAIAELVAVPELARAARWVAASLLAPRPESRALASKLLGELLDAHQAAPGSAPAYLSQAVAARALEASDSAAMQRALACAAEGAFSVADQAAMATLSGSEPRPETLAALAASSSGRILAASIYNFRGAADSASGVELETPQHKAAARLGRGFKSAAALRAALQPPADGAAAATQDDAGSPQALQHAALTGLLALEHAVANQDFHAAAERLSALAGPEADTGRQLVAALAHEITGGSAGALAAYQRAHSKSPSLEAPLRALVDPSGQRRAAALLEQAAEASDDTSRRSLLLVEAAIRAQLEAPERTEGLLKRARDADPTLPFAYRQAELSARVNGDPARLLEWLRYRRDAASDPVERAHDQVREALLTADEDLASAAELLGQAAEVRPDDVGLRELNERLNPGSSHDRGAWREAAAATADQSTRGRLLLEAALNYERDGDGEAAARAARASLDSGGDAFAALTRERTAAGTQEAADLADLLLTQAKTATEPGAARELYERLSALDLARGDSSSALLWQSAILEDSPGHLPSLRHLEHAYLAGQRDEDLIAVESALATLLPHGTGLAHCVLATRLIKKTDEWINAKDVVYTSNHPTPKPYWLLRHLAAFSQATGDDAKALEMLGELASQSDADLDAATLYLRAAETAARLGDREEARRLLERAIERVPEHLVALTTRADVLETSGDSLAAASALEAVAQASAVERHQLEAWYQAGVLWLDRAGDPERGALALEHAATLDVTHADVFERLRQLYIDQNERGKLASLLEARLSRTTDPTERVALEVTRAQALAEIGDRGAARAALAAALDANPDHVDALAAFAELCSVEQEWPDAEQAWIRLARHTQDREKQAEIYRKLGAIYEHHIPTPDRAELSYRELLKRVPDDIGARERLVQVYAARGDAERALAVQEELVKLADTPDASRDRSLELAQVYEQVAGDKRKAEAILERARKAAPTDALVLRALAAFYTRTGETRALTVLLDRTANDARRALSTGRFDPAFFEALSSVADLRGDTDAALVAAATLHAIQGGEPLAVRGGGAAAGQPRLDDFLAPDLLTLPLRAFLQKTGSALDGAYPLDTRAMRAQPVPQEAQAFRSQILQLATSFGIHNIDVLIAPGLGMTVTPVSTNPPQIVISKELLDGADQAVLYFLVFRALKLIQANACALSRTAPIDLWPVLAALLSLFAENWQPQGADPKRFAVAQQRLRASLPRNLDDDVPVLALEVIGSIGNRASQLAASLHEWGSRTGLLAVGDPRAALRAIGGGELPDDDAERAKWVTRNTEARDLAIFSVSEKYGQARQALGL